MYIGYPLPYVHFQWAQNWALFRVNTSFLKSCVHRVPPSPMYIGYPPPLCTQGTPLPYVHRVPPLLYVHRVPPPLCTQGTPSPMYIGYPPSPTPSPMYIIIDPYWKIFVNLWVDCIQLFSSPRQTARGPAATWTQAAQVAGYKNVKCFFSIYFFWKNNLAKFWKFWEFFGGGVYYGFHWKSAFQCKVPFRPHWWVEKFQRKKKFGCRIRKFSCFLSQKTTFLDNCSPGGGVKNSFPT